MKKIKFLLATTLLCLMTVVPCFSGDIGLDEAVSHFNNGRFQKAIDQLETLLVTEVLGKEDYLTANEYLAVAYLSKDNTEKVRAVFTRMLQKSPDYRPNDQWWPHQRLMSEYFKTLKAVGQSLKVSSEGSELKTIAIMDFENNSIDNAEKYENLGNALSKIIINDFSVISNLKVVERERLRFILDELELSAKKVGEQKVVDAASAPRLGKLLGAHSFVFGSFIQVGKTFRIDARLVQTETGEILKTFSVDGKPDNLFDLARELTLKITSDLDIAIGKADAKQLDKLGREEIPIEAVALFGDAMSKANQEQYQDALNSLQLALKQAPDFTKAQEMVNVLKPLALDKS